LLKPKRSLHKLKESASRQFTDREEPKKSFHKALLSLDRNQHKVLVFYGVGGIGKSRLLAELQSISKQQDVGFVDLFIDFREEKHREPSEALIWFRQQLISQHKVKFTTFDLAYAVYWSKMKPQQTLKSEQSSIPFLEEGNFVGELISHLENLPVVQWIPKTIKLIDGIYKYKEITQWWNGRGKEVLSDLKDMHPKDIEDMLLVYWAADFSEWLKTHNRKAIFLFDTYEALWEKNRSFGSYMEKDEWIRELILQFEDVPVLNVICGREKITWEKLDPEWLTYIEQHLMGELSPADCKNFLHSCGIVDEEIQEVIIKGSQGLPYYLDLMVDTFQLIQRKRIPVIDDFSKRPEEVLQRFLRYLDRPEKETLKILSITRLWSEPLFAALITEFKTFYPTTAYAEFCEFSFIHDLDQSGYKTMHSLMKVGLQEQVLTQSQTLLEQVHSFLFHYYTNKLSEQNQENDIQTAFTEGLFHGDIILTDQELIEWLSKHCLVLLNKGKWSSLIHEFERIIELKTNDHLLAFSHQRLGELFAFKGQYKLAEQHFIDAIKRYEEERKRIVYVNSVYKNIAQIQKRLGDLYRNTNEYDKSIQAFMLAIENLEKIGEDDKESLQEISFISTRLGKIYKLQSNYELAKQYYQKALDGCKQLIDSGHSSSSIHGILGQTYEKLGELTNEGLHKAVEPELSHFFQAIEAYDIALQDREMVDFIPTLAHQGLAYKRLAEHYSKDRQLKEKLDSFHKAIDIYHEVIRLAPDYVDGYEMRGHASVDLLDLYTDIGQFKKGLESFELAVQSFESALVLSDKQGSSRNRLSSSYRSLGRLYRTQKNYTLAIEAFETALQKNDELFIHSPEYIYGHNSRGKIYKEMGDCFVDMQDKEKAVKCYSDSLSCFEKSLIQSPNSRTALSYQEKLQNLINQLTYSI